MKQIILTLTLMFTMLTSVNAMSYEQARDQALFLTDKMAYELNLTEDQYEAAYEINLDYLLGVNTAADVYAECWTHRNLDLSYILLDWQYRMFCDATYFYRPIWWGDGFWHFGIYARYPHRDYFFFDRPAIFVSYRGGHSWGMNGGRSWYNGHFGSMSHGSIRNGMGMRDSWNRNGGYRSGVGSNGVSTGRGHYGTINNGGTSGRGNFGGSSSVSGRGNYGGSVTNGRGTYNNNNGISTGRGTFGNANSSVNGMTRSNGTFSQTRGTTTMQGSPSVSRGTFGNSSSSVERGGTTNRNDAGTTSRQSSTRQTVTQAQGTSGRYSSYGGAHSSSSTMNRENTNAGTMNRSMGSSSTMSRSSSSMSSSRGSYGSSSSSMSSSRGSYGSSSSSMSRGSFGGGSSSMSRGSFGGGSSSMSRGSFGGGSSSMSRGSFGGGSARSMGGGASMGGGSRGGGMGGRR